MPFGTIALSCSPPVCEEAFPLLALLPPLLMEKRQRTTLTPSQRIVPKGTIRPHRGFGLWDASNGRSKNNFPFSLLTDNRRVLWIFSDYLLQVRLAEFYVCLEGEGCGASPVRAFAVRNEPLAIVFDFLLCDGCLLCIKSKSSPCPVGGWRAITQPPYGGNSAFWHSRPPLYGYRGRAREGKSLS